MSLESSSSLLTMPLQNRAAVTNASPAKNDTPDEQLSFLLDQLTVVPSQIIECLRKGASLTTTNSSGKSLLMIALISEWPVVIIDQLIQNYIARLDQIQAVVNEAYRWAHVAKGNRNKHLIEMLQRHGAKPLAEIFLRELAGANNETLPVIVASYPKDIVDQCSAYLRANGAAVLGSMHKPRSTLLPFFSKPAVQWLIKKFNTVFSTEPYDENCDSAFADSFRYASKSEECDAFLQSLSEEEAKTFVRKFPSLLLELLKTCSNDETKCRLIKQLEKDSITAFVNIYGVFHHLVQCLPLPALKDVVVVLASMNRLDSELTTPFQGAHWHRSVLPLHCAFNIGSVDKSRYLLRLQRFDSLHQRVISPYAKSSLTVDSVVKEIRKFYGINEGDIVTAASQIIIDDTTVYVLLYHLFNYVRQEYASNPGANNHANLMQAHFSKVLSCVDGQIAEASAKIDELLCFFEQSSSFYQEAWRTLQKLDRNLLIESIVKLKESHEWKYYRSSCDWGIVANIQSRDFDPTLVPRISLARLLSIYPYLDIRPIVLRMSDEEVEREFLNPTMFENAVKNYHATGSCAQFASLIERASANVVIKVLCQDPEWICEPPRKAAFLDLTSLVTKSPEATKAISDMVRSHLIARANYESSRTMALLEQQSPTVIARIVENWNKQEVEALFHNSLSAFAEILMIMIKGGMPLTPAVEAVIVEQAKVLTRVFVACCDATSFQYFKATVGEARLREIVNASSSHDTWMLTALHNCVFPGIIDELLELATVETVFSWRPAQYDSNAKMQALGLLQVLLDSPYDTYVLDYIHEKYRWCGSDAAAAASADGVPSVSLPREMKNVFEKLSAIDAAAFRFAYDKCEQLIRQKRDNVMNRDYENCAVLTFSNNPLSFMSSTFSSALSNRNSLTILLQQLLDKPTIKPAEVFDLLGRGADITTKNTRGKDTKQIAESSKPAWPKFLLERLNEISQHQQKNHAESIATSAAQQSSGAAILQMEESVSHMHANNF